MNKQYLMLNLESDTFKGMKAEAEANEATVDVKALFRRIATVPCSCVILCAMTALIAIPAPATIAMAATSGSRR